MTRFRMILLAIYAAAWLAFGLVFYALVAGTPSANPDMTSQWRAYQQANPIGATTHAQAHD
jgi:hypothetical protein